MIRGLAAGVWLICLMLPGVNLGSAAEQGARPAAPAAPKETTAAAEKLGIKSLGVWLLAAGNMLEFRYVVLDAKKSKPTFDKKLKTYLLEQGSGEKLDIPVDTKFGPVRASSRAPEVGREYYIMFKNFGHAVKRGSVVTLVIGDSKLENITVQ